MAKKKVKKVDMNKRTAQFRETNPNEFNASEYEYIYKVNRTSGEISLYKGGKEIPNDIQTQFGGLGQPDNVIKPPWDTYELEWLLKYNHTHRRCMELKSTLVAGFGYDFRNKNHSNYPKLEAWAKKPNSTFGDTLSNIAVNVKRQHCSFGYGPLIIKKAFDTIQMFDAKNTKSTFVIPNFRNGRNVNGIRKYVQLSKNTNEKVEYFPYNGNPKLGRDYMHWFGYKTLSSSYYPEPEYLPAKDKIYEDIFVDKNNIDFFKNRAMGDFVILFTGSKLDGKTKNQVSKDFKQNMSQFEGVGNQHKTMYLHSPGKDAKIQVVDISKNEDGQYSKRQSALEASIARAWGITPSLISLTKNGSGFGGGSVAIGDLFLENQIMIRPEQRDFEEAINLILESLFGFDPQIKFRTIDTNNQKDMAVILTQIVSSGTPISKIEARRYIHEHGLMELENPETIPEQEDLIEPNERTQVDNEGNIKPDGDTDSNQDDINSIDEDKFSE